jgi:ABC-type multidrug transport system ATPase subunit
VEKIREGKKKALPPYYFDAESKLPHLDEPTNDLDITTQQVLEDFLEDYPAASWLFRMIVTS